jgi:uncharacterized protein YndB with AHSA1/START domain
MDARKSGDRKLVVDVVGEREIVMTRTFAAPRALVFDAWTKPEQVSCWLLGPDGWTMPVCEIDLRVGGAYRYVLRRDDGREMIMKGIYREIVAPERLVCTESFGDAPGPEAINTFTFVERGGETTLTLHTLSPTRDVRDAMIRSGMERGVTRSFERLDVMFEQAGAKKVSR